MLDAEAVWPWLLGSLLRGQTVEEGCALMCLDYMAPFNKALLGGWCAFGSTRLDRLMGPFSRRRQIRLHAESLRYNPQHLDFKGPQVVGDGRYHSLMKHWETAAAHLYLEGAVVWFSGRQWPLLSGPSVSVEVVVKAFSQILEGRCLPEEATRTEVDVPICLLHVELRLSWGIV